MFDLPENAETQGLTKAIYEQGGIAAAVCHGPCGLVNVKLSNGKYLLEGKECTGFTNAEEEATGFTKEMPFLLETRMKERGGKFTSAGLWQAKVCVSDRVATGQNPASATPLAEAMLKVL